MPSFHDDDDSKVLQDYTKNLLNSLKQQQIKTNYCLNSIQSDPTDFSCKHTIQTDPSSFLKSFNEDVKKKLLKFDLDKLEKAQKTVSFNDYMNETVTRARRRQRRCRSLSPRTHASLHRPSKHHSPKSILKKNVYETDTDDYENYVKLKNLAKTDRSAYIECLTKSRQKYLNYLYNDDLLNESISDKKKKADLKSKKLKNQIVDNTKFSDSDGASHWNHLFDEGNNRLCKSPITNLIRPKSEPVLNTIAKANRSPSKKGGFRMNKSTILGYDWITDALENRNSSIIDKSDDYWNEIISFRKYNQEDCMHDNFGEQQSFFNFTGVPANDDMDNYKHKCIHSYTLNERLFPIPTYVNENGESICPVCKSSRREPTNYSPQFCKISIPQSKLLDNYQVKPQKRSQYSREDTLSLSENTLKNTKAQLFGRSKNVDLKSATGSPSDYVKFTTDDMKRIATNRDPTAELYNKGHAMRYELENHHQQRLRELTPKMNIK